MTTRKLALGVAVLCAAGAAGWYGWRQYTTPRPPSVQLEGVTKEKVEKVESATDGVRRQPRSGKAWGELGMTLLANGFPKEAAECFGHAERFDRTEPRWPYFHGVALLAAGRREGLDKLRAALATARTSTARRRVLFSLTFALIENGELDEAAARARDFRAAEDGDTAAVDFVSGTLAYGQNNHQLAREHLSRLLNHPAARRRACSLLATIADGDRAAAAEYQRRAAELPEDQEWPDTFESELRRYRAETPQPLAAYHELRAQGRHDEAIVFLQDLVRERPDEPACATLGFDLLTMNRYAEAIAAYGQQLRLNPRSAKAHMLSGVCALQLGETHLRAGERDRALERFREAVAREDAALALQYDLPDAHLARARALRHLGRSAEAIDALRQAVRVGTEFAEMHQALGEALAETGQVREGLEHLENAVRLAKPKETKPREALDKWKPKANPKP